MLLVALLLVPALVLRFAIIFRPLHRLSAGGVVGVLFIAELFLAENPTAVGAISFLVLSWSSQRRKPNRRDESHTTLTRGRKKSSGVD